MVVVGVRKLSGSGACEMHLDVVGVRDLPEVEASNCCLVVGVAGCNLPVGGLLI